MSERPIEHISDTARWVAVYRAMETERPDAHFKDPYARMLAGERGQIIVDKIKGGKRSAWAMIVRTAVFDQIILRLINEHKVDTVLNLAAGLDTRAYRLPLPGSLRWIDVDLPGILEYKEEKLQDARPVCNYQTEKIDLAEEGKRRELFQRIGAESRQVMIITEGLLVYLTREQVAALAKDLSQQPSFRWWMLDIASPVLLALLKKWYHKTMEEGGVSMKFAPEEGPEFFRPYGWEVAEFHRTQDEARRLNREMPGSWLWKMLGVFLPKKTKEGFRNVGQVLLQRA
jgi:methyltransferase (TIGR00027 family)